MALHVLKPTRNVKEVNKKEMQKRGRDVKKTSASKKECSKMVSPIVRAISLVAVRNDVAKRQVG